MERKEKPKKPVASCETCEYFDWDDDVQDNVCKMDMDEDELWRLRAAPQFSCPYYKFYDEYKSVQKQI